MRIHAEVFTVVGTEVFPTARKTDVLVEACVLSESKVWYGPGACHWYSSYPLD